MNFRNSWHTVSGDYHDLTLIHSFTQLRLDHSQNPVVIVGDFNVHKREWLGSPTTSSAGTAVCGLCETFGQQQLVDRGTCKSTILDLVITECSGTVTYHPHLGSSDHVGLLLKFIVRLQVPPPLTPQPVYHWKMAPWNHVCGHFLCVQWDVLKTGTISDANGAFNDIITQVHDHYVSSTIPRPTKWWNCFCQCTYQKKVQCWAKRDWPAYHAAVSAARRAQAITFSHYRNSLLLKLKTGSNDRLWWKMTKDIKPKTRSAPDVGSLATYFANKLSLPTDFDPASSL